MTQNFRISKKPFTAACGETPWMMVSEKKRGIEHMRWSVDLAPLRYEVPGAGLLPVPTKYRVGCYRTDTNQLLSVVSNNYFPIQNQEQEEIANSILDACPGSTLEMCGYFWEGQQTFWVIKRPLSIDIGGDTVDEYVTIFNSHDRSLSFKAAFTPVRVKCANALVGMYKNSDGVVIRHNKKATQRILDFKRLIQNFDSSFDWFYDIGTRLHEAGEMHREDISKFLLRAMKRGHKTSEELAIDFQWNWLEKQFEKNLQWEEKNASGNWQGRTPWIVYNAFSAYVSHQGSGPREMQSQRVLAGSGKVQSKRAFDTLLDIVGIAA